MTENGAMQCHTTLNPKSATTTCSVLFDGVGCSQKLSSDNPRCSHVCSMRLRAALTAKRKAFSLRGMNVKSAN